MKRLFFVVLVFGVFLYDQGGFALHAARRMARFDKSHCQHPKWSPDGKYLSYEVRHVNRRIIELRILDLATKKTEIVRPTAMQVRGFSLDGVSSEKGMVSRELAWAPKKLGFKYLFSSNGSGSVYDIYQSREGRLKVSSAEKNDGQPAWSSDGKRVVFTSARTGKGDLYWYNINKMRVRRLTKDSESTEFFATWSPSNPRQIAYVRHTDQDDRIYLIENVFAPTPKRLTTWRKKLSELNPTWSPDGQQIAFFTVDSEEVYDLYVSDLEGKAKRLVRNIVKSDQYGPAWSPDGKKLFYVKKLGQNKDQIHAIDIASGNKTAIRTNTVVNNELSIVERGGKWHLAFTAQGKSGSTEQIYRKLYVHSFDPL